jgi:GTP-binding protein HflX
MDLYEQNTFDPWLDEEVRAEILRELEERWQRETNNNAVFVAAIEKKNIESLRATILNKVRDAYQARYPYRTEYLY